MKKKERKERKWKKEMEKECTIDRDLRAVQFRLGVFQ